jgi:hypothetical protein
VRSILPVISVLGLLGAGAAVTWSVLSRPEDTYITREGANSFNLQTGPAPARPPMALAPGESLRDAVAAAPPAPSSLMRVIATPGMAVGGLAKDAADKRYTVITPKAEAWAKKHKFLSGLIAKPASFLMSRSSLGSARGLRAFLADPKKVDAYMNSTLVRVTLNSPTVAKALLGNPAVIRAFLATPALRDPQTVRALLSSPMLHKMLDCPAIQEALGDPEVMMKMVADPQTIAWIASHPQALMAIAEAAPALGDAFGAKTGR